MEKANTGEDEQPGGQPETDPESPDQIAICGAGIVGLVLALALHKQTGVKPVLYEQAPAFHDGVGAAIGMYPNGLRVIRDISPDLLDAIRQAGCPYEFRRWMRHDGTEVAVANEQALTRRDDDLHSIGIRRWNLQKILYDAVIEAGIEVNFGKRIEDVAIRYDALVEITFADYTKTLCKVLLGADGARSKVREFVSKSTDSCSKLNYTGTTCLFGLASWPRPERGICFPTATTTKCHGCFFPINDHEQCFQFHFPVNERDADEATWGVLGRQEGQDECRTLAQRLKKEGWDEQFLNPLENVSHVVRFGFSLLEPSLRNWAFGPVVLMGDAAHPPVPYLGQGCQMGLEDAGTLATLMSRLCVDDRGSFDLTNFHKVSRAFETMRMRRTGLILKYSQITGKQQERRTRNKQCNLAREASIRLQVQRHGTLPLLLPGAHYDYKEDVNSLLLQVKIRQQPTSFRFKYTPYQVHSPYHVPNLLEPGGVPPEEYREPRPQLLTRISELSRETSTAGEDDDDVDHPKNVHPKSSLDRATRLRRLIHPSLPGLPAMRKKHSGLAA